MATPSRPPRRRPRHGPSRTGKGNQSKGISTSARVTQAELGGGAVGRSDSPITDNKEAYFSAVRFRDFHETGLLSQETLARIPFDNCTEVQAETLEPILRGADVFGQAKTGTGKTLAFLIPAIERLSRQPPGIYSQPADVPISVLVLATTRELALQIEAEANMLCKTGAFKVQSVVGGTNIKAERFRLSTQRCDILIATPGRLCDHLETSQLAPRMSKVQCFIMDEADRLLDGGFRPQLEQVLAALPSKDARQTLMFSATVTSEVKNVAKIALRSDYMFITTIGEEEDNTHEHVDQRYVVCPLGDVDAATLLFVRGSLQSNPTTKIMAFYPTARAAGMAFELFEAMPELHGFQKFQIHSRMSQPARVKATNAFKAASNAILFSSDVTARGIDIPGITAVLQVGLPSAADQYVHRLGRTARAGAGGQGVLILASFERFFLRTKEIAALPLKKYDELEQILADHSNAAYRSANAAVREAYTRVANQSKEKAYQAFLGYYSTSLKNLGWSKEDLVKAANSYAFDVLGYQSADGKPPGLFKKTIGMMGMKGVPGTNIISDIEVRTRRDAQRPPIAAVKPQVPSRRTGPTFGPLYQNKGSGTTTY